MSSNNKKFKPFDKILVSDGKGATWGCAFFSHIEGNGYYKFCATNGIVYRYCIPYKGNESLVGQAFSEEHLKQ